MSPLDLDAVARKRLDDDICARIDHQDAIPLIDVAIRRRSDDRRSDDRRSGRRDRRRCDRIVERTSVTRPIIVIRRLAISRSGNNRCRAGVTIERLRIGIRGEATYGSLPRHDLAVRRPCRWTDGPHRLDSFDCLHRLNRSDRAVGRKGTVVVERSRTVAVI